MSSSGCHRKTITYKIKAKHTFKKFSYALSASTPTILTARKRVFSFPLLDNNLSQNLSCVSSFPAHVLEIQLLGFMHKYFIPYAWRVAVHSKGIS